MSASEGSDAGVPGPLSAPVLGLALRVDVARQTTGYASKSDGRLELSVTLVNGVGGTPVILSPALFRLETKDGLLQPPVLDASRLRWVDGHAPPAAAELAAGATFSGWGLAFDVPAGSAVRLAYAVPPASANEAALGERRATAPVSVEACAPCQKVCTYLDREPALCCDGAAPTGGTCVNHLGVCPDSKALCSSAGARGCVDLTTDVANCGACGAKVPAGTSCKGGKMTCIRSVETACGETGCFDLSSNPRSCGTCGHVCSGVAACHDGKCGGSASFAEPATDTSCNALCGTLGLRCADVGGYHCAYNGDDTLGRGECGMTSGTRYDNSGIPGGGGSSGTKWYGAKCSDRIMGGTYHRMVRCHCVQ